MKKIEISILFLVVILFNSCDNSVGPTLPKTSGETTINTTIVNLKGIGFSFSQGGNIEYPNSQNIITDIIVMIQISANGDVVGVFFGSGSSLKHSFNLVKQFNNIDSAQSFFNNLNEVPDSNYEALAIPVKAYQIWAVKTVENKFGKILILKTDAYDDTSNPSLHNVYGEASFKWKYQPNGSTKF